MADTVLVREGASYGIQEFKQAIFEKRPVQALFKQSKYHHFYPQSGSVRGSMGGNFLIPGSQKLLDFGEAYMYLKIRLMRGDAGVNAGKNFPPNTKVWPICDILPGVFKTLKTSVGQQVITNHESNFAYTSYVQDLLNRSYGNRTEVLDGAGFYLDDTGQFDTFDYDKDTRGLKNSGAERRLRRFAECTPGADDLAIDWESFNSTAEVFGSLNLDISDLALGTYPNLDVNLNFTLQEPRFFLQAEPSARDFYPTYEVLDMQLLVLKRTLPTDNYLSLTRPIVQDKKSTIQQFTLFKMTSYPIPEGSTSFSVENFQGSGNVGTRLIIAFVLQRAYTGDYALNPFYFCQQFGTVLVKTMSITLDSEEIDGFSVLNGGLRINTRVLYQRFLRFLGTSQSTNYTSGIGFNDFSATGGVRIFYVLKRFILNNFISFSFF